MGEDILKMIVYLADLTQIIKDRGVTKVSSISSRISRKILSKELGILAQDLKIKRNPFGKPFLEGQKRHFNISYSNNMFLMATDNAPIGVDIEHVKEIEEINNLIEHFHPKEKRSFHQTEKSKKLHSFYRLWVLKECYIKAIGKGLSCSLDSFYIRIDKASTSLICSEEKDLSWKLKSYSIPGEYALAICARHDEFPREFINLSVNDLLPL